MKVSIYLLTAVSPEARTVPSTGWAPSCMVVGYCFRDLKYIVSLKLTNNSVGKLVPSPLSER
jgi:hypothetical protein